MPLPYLFHRRRSIDQISGISLGFSGKNLITDIKLCHAFFVDSHAHYNHIAISVFCYKDRLSALVAHIRQSSCIA